MGTNRSGKRRYERIRRAKKNLATRERKAQVPSPKAHVSGPKSKVQVSGRKSKVQSPRPEVAGPKA
jgi:hypothetical protein